MQLRRMDGDLVSVPLERLSTGDRRWVRDELARTGRAVPELVAMR